MVQRRLEPGLCPEPIEASPPPPAAPGLGPLGTRQESCLIFRSLLTHPPRRLPAVQTGRSCSFLADSDRGRKWGRVEKLHLSDSKRTATSEVSHGQFRCLPSPRGVELCRQTLPVSVRRAPEEGAGGEKGGAGRRVAAGLTWLSAQGGSFLVSGRASLQHLEA